LFLNNRLILHGFCISLTVKFIQGLTKKQNPKQLDGKKLKIEGTNDD
jgi:hypothetical protein